MCDPKTAAAVALPMFVAAPMAMQALAPKVPEIPKPPEPAAAPATSKQPDQQALRAAAVMAAGGPPATQLTGPGGVAPSLLNIGKNSLLGS